MAHLSNMGQQAVSLALKGLYVIPLCWPNLQGECACPMKHTGHNIGKAPLTRRGINDSSKEIRQIWDWWLKWPDANIAVDLGRSQLIAIAPDSEEWHQQFLNTGLPDTYIVQSGGGPGHLHYYYKRPADTPLINDNKPNQYDIQPRGYVVAEGSLHQSTRRYSCISTFTWKDVHDLPFAPQWVLQLIQRRWDTSKSTTPIDINEALPPVPTHLIKGRAKEWWEGRQFISTPEGVLDRSATLVAMARLLARRGATPADIVVALKDRDENLGYHKYSRRRDGGYKSYKAIAQLATTSATTAQRTQLEEEHNIYDSHSNITDITHDPYEDLPHPAEIDDIEIPGLASQGDTKGSISWDVADERTWRRSKVADAYTFEGDRRTAGQVMRCSLYRKPIIWGCNTVEGIYYHCNKFGCPNCQFIRLKRLFDEKEEPLKLLVNPVVYKIQDIITLPVPVGDIDLKADIFERGTKFVRDTINKWGTRKKNKVQMATDSVYALLCDIDDNGMAHFGAVLLGNWEDATYASLYNCFSKNGTINITIEQRRLPKTDAITFFQKVASVNFTWESPEEFIAWKLAQKRKKLVQGKGQFSKVSGNKPAKSAAPTTGICPIHGVEETFVRMALIGPPEYWRPERSVYTGRVHYYLIGDLENLLDLNDAMDGSLDDT